MKRPLVVACAVSVLLGAGFAATAQGQVITPDLSKVADGKGWKVAGRKVSAFAADGKKGVRFDKQPGQGVAWLDDIEFVEGTIELDIKGEDKPQQSFVGVAFRVVDEKTHDAVYFRPFNFKTADAARRVRAVQYVSHPQFPWQKLRKDKPGMYEQAVNPVPDPDGWFQARIVVEKRKVSVFMDAGKEPCLVVEELSDRKGGKVGLWVGEGSGGEFANLKITPAKPKPAVPLDPIDAIFDAFRTHQVVALDEGDHTNEPGAKFRLKLLRDPRFPTVVNDIVVECGNALYQDVMDRFVTGEEVPYDTLKQVWQNTAQPYEVWDHVIYEEFFRAVRSLNATLPRERRLRVLLGDPPINWDKIHSAKDWLDFMKSPIADRDAFPSGLIRREVLAKGRRALVVYGGMHLLRGSASYFSAQAPTVRKIDSLVDLLERDGAKVFTIWANTFSDLEQLQSDVRSWKEPSLFLLKGTIPGAADFTTYYPGGGTNAVGPMEKRFDAVLYLGHPLTFTYSPISPGLATDEKYIAMRATRVGYRRILFEERGVKPPAELANWAAGFRARSQQPRPILPQLWRTYIASGMAAALASLPKDSKEIPQGVQTLHRLSEAVLKRGKIDDAIAAANKNAELFPRSPRPYLVLGAAYSAKGDKAQAAVHYGHALRLDPRNKKATGALARPGY